jgi:hypothetical protein
MGVLGVASDIMQLNAGIGFVTSGMCLLGIRQVPIIDIPGLDGCFLRNSNMEGLLCSEPLSFVPCQRQRLGVPISSCWGLHEFLDMRYSRCADINFCLFLTHPLVPWLRNS